MNTKPKLRFAALIRVSTERQEEQGESLENQRNAITRIVKEELQGKIVGWYGGQEHGTPGYEKKEVDRLLSDATKRKFDAVITDRNDRWSRDNEKSSQGLRIFRENGIRFFSGLHEFDLFDPADELFVNMNVTIAQYFARYISKESRRGKVERAKKGEPSSGLLPFGRTFNKDTKQWGIDREKQVIIETAAMRYLNGESIMSIADDYGMDGSGLRNILMNRCGDTWSQKFKKQKKDENGNTVYDVYETKIPRLLPKPVIKALHQKAAANKTFTHGDIKNHYLLSRVIFCGHCDYSLFGQTTTSGYTYYRHTSKKHPNKSAKKCNRKDKCNHVPTKDVEDTVLAYLYDMFGNPAHIQQAVERAIPDMKKVEGDRRRLIEITALLKQVNKKRNSLMDAVCDEVFTKQQIKSKADELNSREEKLANEEQRLNERLANVPSSKDVKNVSMKIAIVKRGAKLKPFSEMTDSEKRLLLQMVFSGKTSEGKRHGIYIKWHDSKHWSFSIYGQLVDENDLVPLTEQRREAVFDLDGGGTAYKQKELLTKQKKY